MNLKCFKLAVFDLDGTLVEYGSDEVTSATLDTINMLHENGVRATIATGRSWKQTRTLAHKLRIQAPVIVQSGAIIINPVTEKVLKTQPLRPYIERKLHGIIDNLRIDQFRLSESGTYFADRVSTAGGKWLLENNEDCRLAAMDRDRHRVIKHLFIGTEAELRHLLNRVGELKPTPNTILWPPDNLSYDWFLEVFDPLASKGRALTWLASYLGLSWEQIIAFGDGHNDTDMLKTAGFGVAMRGAPPELINQADLIIPGPAEEGIARLFRGEPVGVRIKAS